MAGKLEISRKIILENKRQTTDSDAMNWYAIRVTYSRELKFQTLLQESGFQTFVPMCRRTFEKNGKKENKLVPAVSNLIFVHSEKADLDAFMTRMGETCPARFIWDKSTRKPIVVPDKAMEDFIKVSSSMDEDLIYITEITEKLREGQTVRVVAGPFKGVEGKVVRIRKSRRVLVELPGMLAVATTFVNPSSLEII